VSCRFDIHADTPTITACRRHCWLPFSALCCRDLCAALLRHAAADAAADAMPRSMPRTPPPAAAANMMLLRAAPPPIDATP
jgi:hypothetical protein